MIIPLGHDRNVVRRWPVVTFAVIGLCALTFVASALAPQADPEDAEARFAEAARYYLEHPGLSPDPLLRQWIERAIRDLDAATAAAARARLDAPAEPPSPLDRTRQEKLDGLTGAWLAALRSGPFWSWGLVPAQFSADRLLTHLFVHAGVFHLLFNMLFLYLSAPFIEDVWGRPLFAVFYLLAGVIPAGLYAARYPDLSIPLVGASGAVAGVMGAFLVRHPAARIRLFYFTLLFGAGIFTAPAWAALLVWAGGELLSAQLMDRIAPGTGGAGVAYWVHVWGFAFGAAVAAGVRGLRLEERYLTPAIEARMEEADTGVLREVDHALASGDAEKAWRVVRDHVLRHPADHDAALTYWDLAQRLGRSREATGVMLRLIRAELAGGDSVSGLRHWQDLCERVPDVVLPVDVAVAVASCLREEGSRGQAATLVARALEQVARDTPARVLVDLARLAVATNAALGVQAVGRALEHPALTREERRDLERLEARMAAAGAIAGPSSRPAPEPEDADVGPAARPAPEPRETAASPVPLARTGTFRARE